MATHIKTQLERFMSFQVEVEKLFAEFFRNIVVPKTKSLDFYPRADVFETADSIVMEIELPGVSASDLEGLVSHDKVILEGIKREEDPAGKATFLCVERSSGRFRRVVEIPKPCDTKKVTAEMKKGVLTIVLTKVEDRREKIRKFDIKEIVAHDEE